MQNTALDNYSPQLSLESFSMKTIIQGKLATAVATISLVMMLGGLAYAYFTATGSGQGDTSVGTSVPLTITQIPDGSTLGDASFSSVTLVPGGPADYLAISISNPSQASQGIHAVTVSASTASLRAVATYNASHLSPEIQATTGDVTNNGVPVPGCLAAWFEGTSWVAVEGNLLVGGNASVTLGNASNGTPDATSTLSVALKSEGVNQDSCKNATVDLVFVSS